jgi:hypothetical protein
MPSRRRRFLQRCRLYQARQGSDCAGSAAIAGIVPSGLKFLFETSRPALRAFVVDRDERRNICRAAT